MKTNKAKIKPKAKAPVKSKAKVAVKSKAKVAVKSKAKVAVKSKAKVAAKPAAKAVNAVTNVLLSGVGGQGTILASNILTEVFLGAGYDVKKSEVHGMAQRGGDVTTHFRFGKKVYSPLIKAGDVDFLLSFEQLEALRYINWLKDSAKVVVNNQQVFPPAVNLGQAAYPPDVEQVFRKYFKDDFHMVNGQEIALRLGDVRAANVVLVGAFSNFFNFNEEKWLDALKNLLPPKILELNIAAFMEGRKAL